MTYHICGLKVKPLVNLFLFFLLLVNFGTLKNSTINMILVFLLYFIISVLKYQSFSESLFLSTLPLCIDSVISFILRSLHINSLLSNIISIDLYIILLEIFAIVVTYFSYRFINKLTVRLMSRLLWLKEWRFIPFFAIWLFDVYFRIKRNINISPIFSSKQQVSAQFLMLTTVTVIFILIILINYLLIQNSKKAYLKYKTDFYQEFGRQIIDQVNNTQLLIHDFDKHFQTIDVNISSHQWDKMQAYYRNVLKPYHQTLVKMNHSLSRLAYVEPISTQLTLYDSLMFLMQHDYFIHIETVDKVIFPIENQLQLISVINEIFSQIKELLFQNVEKVIELGIFNGNQEKVLIISINVNQINNEKINILFRRFLPYLKSGEIAIDMSLEKSELVWIVRVSSE